MKAVSPIEERVIAGTSMARQLTNSMEMDKATRRANGIFHKALLEAVEQYTEALTQRHAAALPLAKLVARKAMLEKQLRGLQEETEAQRQLARRIARRHELAKRPADPK